MPRAKAKPQDELFETADDPTAAFTVEHDDDDVSDSGSDSEELTLTLAPKAPRKAPAKRAPARKKTAATGEVAQPDIAALVQEFAALKAAVSSMPRGGPAPAAVPAPAPTRSRRAPAKKKADGESKPQVPATIPSANSRVISNSGSRAPSKADVLAKQITGSLMRF